jgi:hypothetical protein
MRLWVSLFKTAKPSSLGLDNCRKGSEETGEERAFYWGPKGPPA